MFQLNTKSGKLTLAAALLAFVFGVTPASAQQNEKPSLHVSGEGVVALPVEFAEIVVSIVSQNKNAARAQAETADRADRVVNMLRGEQVKQLKTVRIHLGTIVHIKGKDRDGEREIEYIATNSISFRTDVERAGELLDKSIASGAKNIDSVQLLPSDAALAKARKAAMAAAAKDARDKGDVVLTALGLRAKRISQIHVDANFAMPMPSRMQTMELRESSTPVVGGDAEVRASVRLVIEY